MTLNTDGNLYGTTSSGGTNALYGTVFKVSTSGAFTTIYNFAGSNGSGSEAALFRGTDGQFYGTTTGGGSAQSGSTFSISTSGVLNTLYSFSGPDGSTTMAGLSLGADGNFYGTTSSGALNGYGSIYRLTLTPAFSTTSATSSQAASAYGSPVTLSATVQSLSGSGTPTGSVVFTEAGNPLQTVTLTGGVAAFATSTLAPGQHSIATAYSGDSNFKPSSGSVLQVVNQAAATIALSAGLNPSVYAQSVTFTTTISPPQGSAEPTGTITFTDGATNLAVVTLVGGSAAFTATGLSGGTHSITAAYSGDTNYLAGSATLSQVVTPAQTATKLVPSVNPSVYGQAVTFTATVAPATSSGTPTGTMTFTDGTTTLGVVALSGTSASITAATLSSGTHSIAAAYSGDSNFQPASSTLSQMVAASTTTTTITASQNPSSYNQPVTLTAMVTAPGSGVPTGIITFTKAQTTIATATLSGGVASITTTGLSTGTQTVSAAYGGSTSYQVSSGSMSHQVDLATTTINLVSSLNPGSISSQVTFTATLTGQFGGSPTGTITFLENGSAIGSPVKVATNQAVTKLTFTASGAYNISAVYSGDTNFAGSTSSPLSEQVNLISTKTAVKSSGSPSTVGKPVTFTATVTPASKSVSNGELVTFYNGSTVLGTAATVSGAASFTTNALPAATDSITAVYSGDTALAPSTSAAIQQLVDRNITTTTVSSNLNPSTYLQSVTFSASVASAGGPTPTGSILFKSGTTTIGTGTLNNGVATFLTQHLSGGTNSISASYSGDTYSGTSLSTTLIEVVNPAATTTTITSSHNPSTAGSSVTFSATVTSSGVTPTGSVTFTQGTATIGTATLSGGKASISTATLPSGIYTITATYSAGTSFSGSASSLQQTVN